MQEDEEEAEGAAAAKADDNAASFEDSHLHRLNDKVTEGGFFFSFLFHFFLFRISSSFIAFFSVLPGKGRSIPIYVYIDMRGPCDVRSAHEGYSFTENKTPHQTRMHVSGNSLAVYSRYRLVRRYDGVDGETV